MTKGPGYSSPLEAMANGPREKLLYVPCPPAERGRPDMLATIDCDPASETYSQIVHRLYFPNVDDELHHTGWNACSSCHCDSSKERRYLVLPALHSSRIYSVDTINPREPKLHKTVEPEDVHEWDASSAHTSHCLASGDLLVSFMGDKTGQAKGTLLLVDSNFKVKGRWNKDATAFGYDMWYQPRHNVMLTTEFGAPNAFNSGFNPAEVGTKYGGSVHVWEWSSGKLLKSIDLGPEGLIPLEVRFLHDPASPHAFLISALGSSLVHVYKDEESNEW